MATVDSLELQISSSAAEATKAIAAAIKKLDVFRGHLAAISDSVKSNFSDVNQYFNNIANSMKPMQTELNGVNTAVKDIRSGMKDLRASIQTVVKPMEEAKKSAADLFKDLNENLKDFTPVIDFSQNEAALIKLSNKYKQQIVTTQNEINRILASSAADNQVGKIERLTIKLKEAENGVKAIEEHLQSLSKQNTDASMMQFPSLDGVKPELEEIQHSVEQVKEVMSSGWDYDDNALKYVFGNAAEDIKDYRQAIEKFGNSAGSALNELEVEISDTVNQSQQSLQSLTNTASEIIQELRDKFRDVGIDFKFAGNIEQINEKLAAATSYLDRLIEKEKEYVSAGNIDTSNFERLEQEISRATNVQEILEDLKEKTEGFNQSLQQLKIPEIKEDNLDKLYSSLSKTDEELEKLRIKLANGITMGDITESPDDTKYVRIRESIALTEKQAESLRQRIAEVESQAGNTGLIDRFGASLSRVADFGRKVSSAFENLLSSFKKIGSTIGSVLSKVKNFTKSLTNLFKSSKQVNAAFAGGFKNILKYGLGIASLYTLFNKLRSAIKEGMTNLIQYDERTNQSISMLKSSLNQLKNSLAAAFAPILNMIAPALNTLIQMLIRATNAVNQFISALTGASTWKKAKFVYGDVAESISDAAKAAKGALQPFDKLNNLTSQQDKGNSGLSIGDMFEELPIDDKYKGLADWLKDMWDNADFYDLGKMLGEKLKDALDSIPWNEIKETAKKIGKSIASFINGFIEVEGLGYSIGRTLAEALNTGFEFLNAFVHELHWDSVGKFIAESINGFFQNIDWPLIYDTFTTAAQGLSDAINSFTETLDWEAISTSVSSFFNTLIDTAYIFITETDWIALAEKVGKAISDAFTGIDWTKAGQTVGEAFKAFFSFIATTIENIDWWAVGESVKDFLVGIDWAGVADAFFEAVGAAIGGLAAFIGGLIGEGVENAKQYFQDKIEEAGGNVVEGILVGIAEALVGIGDWIHEHIFKPFIDGFKKAFDINSPSKVMEGMGGYIVSGLLEGLKEKWKDITDWLNEKIRWFKEKFGGIGDKVSGWFGGGSSKNTKAYTITERLAVIPEIQAFNIPQLAPISVSGTAESVSESIGGFKTTFGGQVASILNTVSGLVSGLGAYTMNTAVPYSVSPISSSATAAMARQTSESYASEMNISDNIANAVMRSHSEEMVLLREQNQLLRGILDKEFGISTDEIGRAAQDYAKVYKNRTGRLAYDF